MSEDFKTFNNKESNNFEFDMSISTLSRINYYLMLSNSLSGSENPQGLKDWFDAVRVVDREIDPLIKEDERKDLSKLRNQVESITNLFVNGRPVSRTILYGRVDDYERKIRQLVHKYKLYMKEAEDSGMSLVKR